MIVERLYQGWAQGSFVEAEAEVEAERSRQRQGPQGKAVMFLTEARQGRGRGRELEAEAKQTKFEARPRRGDQWSNYGGARGGLAHLKDLTAPAKHLF